jgi:hypothetical protein
LGSIDVRNDNDAGHPTVDPQLLARIATCP